MKNVIRLAPYYSLVYLEIIILRSLKITMGSILFKGIYNVFLTIWNSILVILCECRTIVCLKIHKGQFQHIIIHAIVHTINIQ